jgi:hypothetical protein
MTPAAGFLQVDHDAPPGLLSESLRVTGPEPRGSGPGPGIALARGRTPSRMCAARVRRPSGCQSLSAQAGPGPGRSSTGAVSSLVQVPGQSQRRASASVVRSAIRVRGPRRDGLHPAGPGPHAVRPGVTAYPSCPGQPHATGQLLPNCQSGPGDSGRGGRGGRGGRVGVRRRIRRPLGRACAAGEVMDGPAGRDAAAEGGPGRAEPGPPAGRRSNMAWLRASGCGLPSSRCPSLTCPGPGRAEPGGSKTGTRSCGAGGRGGPR